LEPSFFFFPFAYGPFRAPRPLPVLPVPRFFPGEARPYSLVRLIFTDWTGLPHLLVLAGDGFPFFLPVFLAFYASASLISPRCLPCFYFAFLLDIPCTGWSENCLLCTIVSHALVRDSQPARPVPLNDPGFSSRILFMVRPFFSPPFFFIRFTRLRAAVWYSGKSQPHYFTPTRSRSPFFVCANRYQSLWVSVVTEDSLHPHVARALLFSSPGALDPSSPALVCPWVCV